MFIMVVTGLSAHWATGQATQPATVPASTVKYAGRANVVFVSVREEQILASRYGIQSIPVQIFFDKDHSQFKKTTAGDSSHHRCGTRGTHLAGD